MSYLAILNKISRLFSKTKIPYMLVGGFAVAYWGYPRQSLDIDIVVDLSSKNINNFLKQLKALKLIYHAEEIKWILKKGNRFVIGLPQEEFRIDIWLPKTQFESQSLKRRKKIVLFGKKINIIRPEDLIISKLIIGRGRDLEDVKGIISRQAKRLDKKYLRLQSNTLSISDSLKKLIP